MKNFNDPLETDIELFEDFYFDPFEVEDEDFWPDEVETWDDPILMTEVSFYNEDRFER